MYRDAYLTQSTMAYSSGSGCLPVDHIQRPGLQQLLCSNPVAVRTADHVAHCRISTFVVASQYERPLIRSGFKIQWPNKSDDKSTVELSLRKQFSTAGDEVRNKHNVISLTASAE